MDVNIYTARIVNRAMPKTSISLEVVSRVGGVVCRCENAEKFAKMTGIFRRDVDGLPRLRMFDVCGVDLHMLSVRHRIE